MTSCQQMGHQSKNLLTEDDLAVYGGAILSPVDYDEADVLALIQDPRLSEFEMVFDPQLYFPRTGRRILPRWQYFPSDFDTGDQGSIEWWTDVVKGLCATVTRIRPSAVCSPAVVPAAYSADYYVLNCRIAEMVATELGDTDVEVLQSVIVRMADLVQQRSAPEIASIVTRSPLTRIYLVLNASGHPRRELQETEELKGAMRLVRYMSNAGVAVLVGFTSSDLILWKTAGAQGCATGKFMNLRRFTPSRWQPSEDGRGQLPYWFEESLFAFLRYSDLIRVRRAGMLSAASLSNPYGLRILDQIDTEPERAWVGLSWRQYMYWFASMERRLHIGAIDPDDLLRSAEQNWDLLEKRGILMGERANDGSWLRAWRRSLLEAFSPSG